MANTIKRLFGPVALTATLTTNVWNNGSGGVLFDIIRQLHISNNTGAPVNLSLYLGATGANAAGTDLFKAFPIPANSPYDWFGSLKMLSTDFLVGGGSAVGLTITGFGEQGVV